MDKKRPKHLALHLIKLPLPGLVSILHRVSGLLLFLMLPLLLTMLQYSLRSIETYTQLVGVLQNPFIKLMLLGLVWAFLHHFFSGPPRTSAAGETRAQPSKPFPRPKAEPAN